MNNNNIISPNLFIEFFKKSLDSLKEKEKIIIGLSGGSSLDIIYPKLKDLFLLLDINTIKKINFAFVDERIVSLDSDESNYFGVNKKFFQDLINSGILKENQIYKINLNSSNIADDYSERVSKIDIALFGVGPDGHIASLFPNHKLLEYNKKSFLEINNSPKPPSKRITISKTMIEDIDFAFIFFIGNSKKNALNNFLNPKSNKENYPVKLVKNAKHYKIISDFI